MSRPARHLVPGLLIILALAGGPGSLAAAEEIDPTKQRIFYPIPAPDGVRVEKRLLTHPRGRHGFDIFDDVRRTREIIGDTVSFVRHHLEAR